MDSALAHFGLANFLVHSYGVLPAERSKPRSPSSRTRAHTVYKSPRVGLTLRTFCAHAVGAEQSHARTHHTHAHTQTRTHAMHGLAHTAPLRAGQGARLTLTLSFSSAERSPETMDPNQSPASEGKTVAHTTHVRASAQAIAAKVGAMPAPHVFSRSRSTPLAAREVFSLFPSLSHPWRPNTRSVPSLALCRRRTQHGSHGSRPTP